jgi:hypothetical protein
MIPGNEHIFRPLQRALGGLLEVLWPAVKTRRTGPRVTASEVEPEIVSGITPGKTRSLNRASQQGSFWQFLPFLSHRPK